MRSIEEPRKLDLRLTRFRGWLALSATIIGLVGAPAAASAAHAPDAYLVSVGFSQTPAPADGAAGQLGSWRCVWSDGTVDDCGSLADYW